MYNYVEIALKSHNLYAKKLMAAILVQYTFTIPIGQVVIPYTKGLAESFKHICGKYGIQVHFKGYTTIKQALMKPKDQDPKEKKSQVICSFQCNHIACDEEYIGETARTLGERCKEHLKQTSPIHAHIQQTGHSITDTSFNIIGREDQGQARTIKESIFIRVNNPTLNQNIGKCCFPLVSITLKINTGHPKANRIDSGLLWNRRQ